MSYDRRSVLQACGTAVATSVGVTGLGGTAAAACGQTYGLTVACEDGVSEARYYIEVPITCDSSTVCDTDFTEVETDDVEYVNVNNSEGIFEIYGHVSSNGDGSDPTGGDIWNIHNAGDFQLSEPNYVVAFKDKLAEDEQNCYTA